MPANIAEFPAPAGQTILRPDDNPAAATRRSSTGSEPQISKRVESIGATGSNGKITSNSFIRNGHKKTPSMDAVHEGQENLEQSTERSEFYGNVFTHRTPATFAREQAYKDSVVVAEVKTNVIVNDEYTFLTGFSDHLAQRFQRSTSSIVINLGHSACLIYGGSFEPAYILTVTALPSLVQSTTNKRNLALLQSFLNKSLNVPAHRGVVRFIGVAEDSFGTRGTTVLGEIESLSKTPLKGKIEERPKTPKDKKIENALPNDHTTTRRRTEDKEMTSKQPRRKSEAATRDRGSQEKSNRNSFKALPVPPMPTQKSRLDIQAEQVQKLGKRRSFRQMFGMQ